MPSVGHFLSLLEAVSRRDWQSVKDVGLAVAEEEKKKKHYTAAHQIMEAVEVASSNSAFDLVGNIASANSTLQSIPPDLLHYEDLSNIDEPVLNPLVAKNVSEFLFEWKLENKLRDVGLAPRQTLLLHGPPGCGKSHLARYIARSLEMRLFTLRFDALISSYLGETGNNLRKVFDFISHNKCVLFIDEIDAIAKLRDDKNELGELKRVVISLLQNLDLSHTSSLLISATNHPHMLDPALWRRFQLVLELTPPTIQARKALLDKHLPLTIPSNILDIILKNSEGLTGADLSTISFSIRRKMLLNPDIEIGETVLISFIEHMRRQANTDESILKKLTNITLELRNFYGKKYTFSELEMISGVPHSTLHHKSNTDKVV